jgi:3-mercaptopyruvate sulfurtransferase SseA
MFRCFGHEAISVLNGGFHKWLAAGLPVESGEGKPVESKCTVVVQYSLA